MTETSSSDPEPSDRRASGLRNHAAAIIALFALAVVALAWFWSRQTQVDAGLGAPEGVMAVGAGTFVAAAIAAIRSMTFLEVLELIRELILGVFALIGAVLRGIGNWFLGLIGLD